MKLEAQDHHPQDATDEVDESHSRKQDLRYGRTPQHISFRHLSRLLTNREILPRRSILLKFDTTHAVDDPARDAEIPGKIRRIQKRNWLDTHDFGSSGDATVPELVASRARHLEALQADAENDPGLVQTFQRHAHHLLHRLPQRLAYNEHIRRGFAPGDFQASLSHEDAAKELDNFIIRQLSQQSASAIALRPESSDDGADEGDPAGRARRATSRLREPRQAEAQDEPLSLRRRPRPVRRIVSSGEESLVTQLRSDDWCEKCLIRQSPQWRYIHRNRFCNACYMRIKRWAENNSRKLPPRYKEGALHSPSFDDEKIQETAYLVMAAFDPARHGRRNRYKPRPLSSSQADPQAYRGSYDADTTPSEPEPLAYEPTLGSEQILGADSNASSDWRPPTFQASFCDSSPEENASGVVTDESFLMKAENSE